MLIKTNSSWLITESIKALEIKISLLFNLSFVYKTVLSCFFFFFLMIDLYFLIPAAIAQIFSPNVELVIPIVMPIKEVNWKLKINWKLKYIG